MTNNEKKSVLTASKCPLCGGKCSIPTSYSDGFDFVRHLECTSCHGVFREVYTLRLNRVETLIEPPKDFDDDKGRI